jgi:hypothetical protein
MTYSEIAKQLKRNIQIMDNTFSANNLKVLDIACKPCADDDADFDLYVEISSITGNTIPNDVCIKINLYDKDDELYLSDDTTIFKEYFTEYDTVKISFYDSFHTLDVAKRGRLYVT